MIEIITFSRFRDAFANAGRCDNFTYDGLKVIFEYLEESQPDLELDVVGICCDFSESDVDEVIEYFDLEVGPDDDPDDVARGYLEDEGILIGETDATFVFHNI